MSVLISAIVLWVGSVIRVSKRILKSCYFSWSRVNRLNLTSSWLKIGSIFDLIESIPELLFSIISWMHQRNPFTAISNYSFVRNASQFSSNRPASRSCSGENRFNDYQGMYLRDSYLLERESRKNQETLASRLMGLEALRYEAQPST